MDLFFSDPLLQLSTHVRKAYVLWSMNRVISGHCIALLAQEVKRQVPPL